jgi:hypothetical protein
VRRLRPVPIKSQAERAYLHIHLPELAGKFEDETPKDSKLPEHVKKMSGGGMACAHCGGAVDEDGMSPDPTLEEDDDKPGEAPQEEEQDMFYRKAIKDRMGR